MINNISGSCIRAIQVPVRTCSEHWTFDLVCLMYGADDDEQNILKSKKRVGVRENRLHLFK